jgi:hypothetical protein
MALGKDQRAALGVGWERPGAREDRAAFRMVEVWRSAPLDSGDRSRSRLSTSESCVVWTGDRAGRQCRERLKGEGGEVVMAGWKKERIGSWIWWETRRAALRIAAPAQY